MEKSTLYHSLIHSSISIFPKFTRFTEDIYQMTGYRPGLYWQLCWRYIGPAIMLCILIASVVFMIIKNPTYSAWSAELVCSSTFTLIYYINYICFYIKGCCCANKLSQLGYGNSIDHDFGRNLTNSCCVPAEKLPMSQIWLGYSSRINSS